jgi:zinc transport system ATP-binding protein
VPIIQASDVRVALGGHPVLTDVSLDVSAGEAVAVLGANGSGKSTLVRALLGVVPATSGDIRLFGVPLGRRTPWARIGYVPQHAPAAAGIPTSALETVSTGMLTGRRLWRPRHAKAAALAALERLGVADLAHRDMAAMSGGQRQRVLIARALVRDVDLLVMDEPLVGVDLAAQEEFAATLNALRAAKPLTVLVVLHELGVFTDVLTRAIVLTHGEIAYDGGPSKALDVALAPAHEHAGHAHAHTEDETHGGGHLHPHGPADPVARGPLGAVLEGGASA